MTDYGPEDDQREITATNLCSELYLGTPGPLASVSLSERENEVDAAIATTSISLDPPFRTQTRAVPLSSLS